MVNFTNEDGSPVRPWDDVDEMNEAMIDNWNSVVGQNDLVYHGGDVVMNRRFLSIMNRLMGRKRLVRGNHDLFRVTEMLEHFDEIYGVLPLKGFVMTHVPIHPSCLERWRVNVHGHTHGKHVMINKCIRDPRYINISVEAIGYTPISLDELRSKFPE